MMLKMYRKLWIFTLSGFIFSFYNSVHCGDVSYAAVFEESFMDCDNFDNSNFLDCSKFALDSSSGSETCIQGDAELFTEISEGQVITLEVSKKGDMADELMFTVEGDICEKLQEEDAPWYPVFSSLNITSCPVFTGTYTCEKMMLDISSANDILTHEYCGSYSVIVKIMDDNTNRNVMSCLEISVGIVELSSD